MFIYNFRRQIYFKEINNTSFSYFNFKITPVPIFLNYIMRQTNERINLKDLDEEYKSKDYTRIMILIPQFLQCQGHSYPESQNHLNLIISDRVKFSQELGETNQQIQVLLCWENRQVSSDNQKISRISDRMSARLNQDYLKQFSLNQKEQFKDMNLKNMQFLRFDYVKQSQEYFLFQGLKKNDWQIQRYQYCQIDQFLRDSHPQMKEFNQNYELFDQQHQNSITHQQISINRLQDVDPKQYTKPKYIFLYKIVLKNGRHIKENQTERPYLKLILEQSIAQIKKIKKDDESNEKRCKQIKILFLKDVIQLIQGFSKQNKANDFNKLIQQTYLLKDIKNSYEQQNLGIMVCSFIHHNLIQILKEAYIISQKIAKKALSQENLLQTSQKPKKIFSLSNQKQDSLIIQKLIILSNKQNVSKLEKLLQYIIKADKIFSESQQQQEDQQEQDLCDDTGSNVQKTFEMIEYLNKIYTFFHKCGIRNLQFMQSYYDDFLKDIQKKLSAKPFKLKYIKIYGKNVILSLMLIYAKTAKMQKDNFLSSQLIQSIRRKSFQMLLQFKQYFQEKQIRVKNFDQRLCYDFFKEKCCNFDELALIVKQGFESVSNFGEAVVLIRIIQYMEKN